MFNQYLEIMNDIVKIRKIKDYELLEAYHHFILYRDIDKFIKEVIEIPEGESMANHLKEKFGWYYSMHGTIKAEFNWLQYNFVRFPERWERFIAYLKENHWNKW